MTPSSLFSNIRYASSILDRGKLWVISGVADEEMLKKVVRAINAKMKVPCTGCGYCMPCPQKVNISGTFSAYNRRYANGKIKGVSEYIKCTSSKEYAPASACIGCGKCESHCPQSIEIRKQLKEAEKELETPLYNSALKAVSLFKKSK